MKTRINLNDLSLSEQLRIWETAVFVSHAAVKGNELWLGDSCLPLPEYKTIKQNIKDVRQQIKDEKELFEGYAALRVKMAIIQEKKTPPQ